MIVQGTLGFQGKDKEEDKRQGGKTTSGLDFNSSQRAAEDRQRWQTMAADVNSGAPTTLMVPEHRPVTGRRKVLHFDELTRLNCSVVFVTVFVISDGSTF